MYRYLFKSARTSMLFLTSVILLSLLMSAVPVSLTSIQSTKMKTEESIANLSRGSYDILVRPDSARTAIEEEGDLIEENFLTGGAGGITVAQYQEILKITDVAVAAPVAVLGFFTNNTGGVSFTLPNPTKHATVTTIELAANTGLEYEYLDLNVTYAVQVPNQNWIMTNTGHSSRNVDGKIQLMLGLPTIYHLVVGIDPSQESTLLGEKGSFLNKLPTGISYKKIPISEKRFPRLPLLFNEDIDSQLMFTTKVRNINRPAMQFMQELFKIEPIQFPEKFKSDLMAPIISEHTIALPSLKPFEEPMFEISEDGKISTPKEYRTTDQGSTSNYYLSERLKYSLVEKNQSKYRLIPDSTTSTEHYRKLTQRGKEQLSSIEDNLFLPHIIDSYKGSDIVSSKFDPSPLGIYGFSPVIQVQDKDGNAVNVELKKNFTPDTFLPIQPAGLTNLETAAWLKGDAPIDAIRVRVANIDGYNKQSEQKILKVATLIQRATGLHTDIVAGASKQNVQVEIPAVGKTPPVGIVQEVWTSLGVAAKIENAINKMSLITLLGLFLIVIVYTIVHTSTQFTVRRKELTVLTAVGWKKQDIRKLMLLEWSMKGTISFILSNGLLLLMYFSIGFSGFWPLVLLVQAFILVCLLGTVFLTVNRIQADTVKLGANMEWSIKPASSPHSIWSASRSNFAAQRKYNLLNITLLSITGAVALFTANMILSVQRNIDTTFLGTAVNEATAVTQWLIVFASGAVTLFGIWEATRAMTAKREQEVYVLRLIGWSQRHIANLMICEVSLILSIGLGIALLIGLGVFRIFYQDFPVPIWNQFAGGIALFLLLLLSCNSLIGRFTKKVV